MIVDDYGQWCRYCCGLLLLLVVVVVLIVVGSGVQQVRWMIKEWPMNDYGRCFFVDHTFILLVHSSIQTLQRLRLALFFFTWWCASQQRIPRGSQFFWFSPLSRGLSETLRVSLYCATLLREALGIFFMQTENELSEVDIWLILAFSTNWLWIKSVPPQAERQRIKRLAGLEGCHAPGGVDSS